MGTRSLTRIFDDELQPILTLYRQMDGYPSGMGKDLAEAVNMPIVNGINDYSVKAANGMPCLAAQVVAKLKTGIGSIYLYPHSTKDAGHDYAYNVLPATKVGNPPLIMCFKVVRDWSANTCVETPMFKRPKTPKDFLKWAATKE